MSLGLVIALAVFGATILGFGLYVRRFAEKFTRDAHTDLSAMFGSSMPQLFAQPFSAAGARITGVVAIAAGTVLLVVALVVVVLQLIVHG